MKFKEKASILSAWLLCWNVASVVFLLYPSVTEHQLSRSLTPPDFLHPLGFDAFGRNLLHLTLYSSALSSLFALLSSGLAILLGVSLGTLCTLIPPTATQLLEKFIIFLLSFPSLIFSLSWAAIRGPGWSTLTFSLLLGAVPQIARLALLRAREVAQEAHVTAARALGAGPLRIATQHIAPSVLHLCMIKFVPLFSSCLIAEATLSYLGIGAPAGGNSWGALLAQGKDYLLEAPHIALGVGIPLVLTLFALSIQLERAQKND